MSFDLEKFKRAKFIPRTKAITQNDLQSFFEAEEQPVFTVRGLTGEEMAVMREEVITARETAKALDHMASELSEEKAVAFAAVINASRKELPEEYVRNLHTLNLGIVEPRLDFEDIKKLSRAFPVAFNELATAVLILTGEGQVEKK